MCHSPSGAFFLCGGAFPPFRAASCKNIGLLATLFSLYLSQTPCGGVHSTKYVFKAHDTGGAVLRHMLMGQVRYLLAKPFCLI